MINLKSKERISIVIPCFNESRCLMRNMDTLIDYLHHQSIGFELLLVNDGSKDSTLEVMHEIRKKYIEEDISVLEYGENRGKGYAVRFGLARTKYEKLFFMDADLSTDIHHIKLFIKLLESHPIVIGSRKKPGDTVIIKQSPFRVMVGKAAKLITSMIIRLDFHDTQCGFKAFNRAAIEDILPRLSIDGFCFDVEMLYVGKMLGYEFEEVPINWQNDPNSSVHPVRDGLRFMRDLIKIRRIHKGEKH